MGPIRQAETDAGRAAARAARDGRAEFTIQISKARLPGRRLESAAPVVEDIEAQGWRPARVVRTRWEPGALVVTCLFRRAEPALPL